MNAKELDHLCRAWKTAPECCPFCACDEQDILYFLSPSGAEGAQRNMETGDYVHFYATPLAPSVTLRWQRLKSGIKCRVQYGRNNYAG